MCFVKLKIHLTHALYNRNSSKEQCWQASSQIPLGYSEPVKLLMCHKIGPVNYFHSVRYTQSCKPVVLNGIDDE